MVSKPLIEVLSLPNIKNQKLVSLLAGEPVNSGREWGMYVHI